MAPFSLLFSSLILTAPPPPLVDVAHQDIPLAMNALVDLAEQISSQYSGRGNKLITPGEFYVAAIEQIYATAGKDVPGEVRTRLLNSGRFQAIETLTQARRELGQVEDLAGLKTYLVGAMGFNKITDPYCGLSWSSNNSFASSDAEFGFGFELEGVSGPAYLHFLLEAHRPQWQGIRAVEDQMVVPTGPRWIISRVIPGSPAATEGLRPGDHITHLDNIEITEQTNRQLFQRLIATISPDARAPGAVIDNSKKVSLRVRRGQQDLKVNFVREAYAPESVFGVSRNSDGSWNHWLDESEKVGYIRLGSLESGAYTVFEAAMEKLLDKGLRGLVLDLRWCPGGYVTPTTGITGSLLKHNQLIYTIQARPGERGSPREALSTTGQYNKVPLVVLVNQFTMGGGEMIAAAIQDHKRGLVIGQRTHGKANIMSAIDTQFYGLKYRVSTGYSLRPSGKNRHRFPESLLTDDWGVRPDKGFEVPVTKELAIKLREQAELHASRPSRDNTALPFDDVNNDPQKLMGLKYLKEVLKK